MAQEYSDTELKQLLHDALWEALPDDKYDPDEITVEDIRITQAEGLYTKTLVPNRIIGEFGSDWDEETVNGRTVRYRIGDTAGINFDEVWVDVLE